MSTTSPAHTGKLTALFLLAGPVASITAVLAGKGTMYLPGDVAVMAAAAVLLAWSPLPISIPAVILGEERDMFEPRGRGIGRGVRMTAWMTSARCPRRLEFLSSLTGFVTAGALAAAGI